MNYNFRMKHLGDMIAGYFDRGDDLQSPNIKHSEIIKMLMPK